MIHIHDIGHSRLVGAIALVGLVGLGNHLTAGHPQHQQSSAPSFLGSAIPMQTDNNIFHRSEKAGLPKGLMPAHGFNTCTNAVSWNDCEGVVVDFDAGTIQDYALTGTDKPGTQTFSAGAKTQLSPEDSSALIAAANRDLHPGPAIPWTGEWTTGICSVQLFNGDIGRNDDFAPSCRGSAVLDVLDRIKEKGSYPSPVDSLSP